MKYDPVERANRRKERSDETFEMTALDLNRLLQKKEVSAVEVTQSFIERAKEVERRSGLHYPDEAALAEAGAVDETWPRRALHPLAGVPLAVKDNFCSYGVRTLRLPLSRGISSSEDAAVVNRARAFGCLLGRPILMSSPWAPRRELIFSPPRNPWDFRGPGGSAALRRRRLFRHGAMALGSDTGGSVRPAAAFCGLVGCGLQPVSARG